jgi:hypothetical protein
VRVVKSVHFPALPLRLGYPVLPEHRDERHQPRVGSMTFLRHASGHGSECQSPELELRFRELEAQF